MAWPAACQPRLQGIRCNRAIRRRLRQMPHSTGAPMNKLLSLTALSLVLSFGAAHAADAPAAGAKAAAPATAATPATPAAPAASAAAPTKQQTRMATCNAEAADKKGDERKAFMKTCLSNKPETQQNKMKACNADEKAKTLKGDRHPPRHTVDHIQPRQTLDHSSVHPLHAAQRRLAR